MSAMQSPMAGRAVCSAENKKDRGYCRDFCGRRWAWHQKRESWEDLGPLLAGRQLPLILIFFSWLGAFHGKNHCCSTWWLCKGWKCNWRGLHLLLYHSYKQGRLKLISLTIEIGAYSVNICLAIRISACILSPWKVLRCIIPPISTNFLRTFIFL